MNLGILAWFLILLFKDINMRKSEREKESERENIVLIEFGIQESDITINAIQAFNDD